MLLARDHSKANTLILLLNVKPVPLLPVLYAHLMHLEDIELCESRTLKSYAPNFC